ncbi:unnamed protein product, partial [Amoebophrya sp. A25]
PNLGGASAAGDASKRPICVAYREGRCEFGAWCFWSHGNDAVSSMAGVAPGGRDQRKFDPAFVAPPTRDPMNRPVLDRRSSTASVPAIDTSGLPPPPARGRSSTSKDRSSSKDSEGSKARSTSRLGRAVSSLFGGKGGI